MDRRHEPFPVRLLHTRLIEPNETTGFLVWKRSKQHGVYRAEHGCRSTDADRERRDRDEREARRTPECAKREGEIARAVLEQSRPARVADILLHLFDTTEGHHCRAMRVGMALTVPTAIVLFHREVEAQLFVELALFAPAKHQRANALDQVGEEAHASSGAR